MHKNILKLMLILSLIVVIPVHAECSYKERAELNKESSNIKVSYEIVTEETIASDADMSEPITFYKELFEVSILNLTDNFYIVVTNNTNNDRKTYNYSNTNNGIITYRWNDLYEVSTQTFKIYASSKTNCANELYRTAYLTLPRYNSYHDWGICEGRDNLSLCDKYVTTKEVSYSTFVDQLTKATKQENNNPNSNNNTTNNTVNPQESTTVIYYIAGGTVAAAILVVVVVVVARKKRNQL